MNYRLLACSTVLLGLAMLTPVEASPPEGGGDRKAEMMKKFDKDGDGQFSDSEKQAAKEAFAKLREGAGGKPGAGKPGAGGAPFDKAAMIKKFDKDGDGQLSEGEKQAAKDAFAKMRGAAGGKPGAGEALRAELIKKFDKDGDGQLSGSEKQAAMEARGAAGKPGTKRPGKK